MHTGTSKVSVIIPVYNVEEYLDECLHSVFNQTYGAENLEILLIEDQSADNSYEKALSYKEKYPEQVILIRNPENMGLGKNRNIGVKRCTGDYFLFLDSDDKLPLDAIENFMKPLANEPDLQLIIGKHQNWYDDKVLMPPIYKQIKLFDQKSATAIHEMEIKDLFFIFDLTPAWAKLYKTEWIRSNQFTAVEGHYYEDALFSMTTIFHASKIKFIQDSVYLYRRDNFSSITRVFSIRKNEDYLKSIEDVRTLLLKENLKEYKVFSDLRFFHVWRRMLFVNCVEQMTRKELYEYEESIKKWMKKCMELTPGFVNRLPLFWRTIIDKISCAEDEDLLGFIFYFKRIKRLNPELIRKQIMLENEKELSFHQLADMFTAIENKLGLFQQKISDVYFWRLIRVAVYETIQVNLGLLGKMGSENLTGQLTLTEQIKTFHSYDSSPFCGEYSKDILVFDHQRRQEYKGESIDYKSYHLLKKFKKEKQSYQVLELPYGGEHAIEASSERKYLESQFLFLEQKNKAHVSFNRNEYELLHRIEKEFYVETGVILEIRNQVKNVIQDFKLKYLYYVKLFKKRKSKQIYLVGGWWQAAIIAAAHDLKIEVIEVQYAAFSDRHLGFSYKNIDGEIPYVPDKILLWGEYWKANTYLPIKEENKIVFGNQFMEEKAEEYKSLPKKKQILFISQAVQGTQINFTARKLAELMPDYQIVVKLHPKEKKSQYESKDNDLPNFSYAVESIDLFQYFQESQFTIGVFSTAVFEAAAFGSNVILLNMVGVEHFQDLIDRSCFACANDEFEVKNLIEDWSGNQFECTKDYFFHSYKNG